MIVQGDGNLIVISMYGIKKTKQFSMNLVSTDMIALMDYFGQTSGIDGAKDGMEYTYGWAVCIDAPTLDESRWVCECEVVSSVATGESDTYFCRIKNVQVDEQIDIDTKGIDLTLFDPVIYSGNFAQYVVTQRYYIIYLEEEQTWGRNRPVKQS